MYQHHRESVDRVGAFFERDPEVEAVLLGGSVAHGFASPESDIDVLIVVADDDYRSRRRDGRLQYFDAELCTYEGGFVDGKYLGRSFLDEVARRGSEPARFAFADAQVVFSRREDLSPVLAAITRYPAEGKLERMQRFYAQFEAWHWYAHEALKRSDRYLLGTAVAKMVLFGGRLILAHNEVLYPYHKWFLRMLERATDRPPDLMERIAAVHDEPGEDNLRALYGSVAFFQNWQGERAWPVQFMLDSELNWLEGHCPVEDL